LLNHETRADALEQLEFRTGWITLGTRIRNGYRHGNQVNSGWIQTWFEFLAPPRASGEKRIPKTGDRIRLTDRLRVDITDYAITGERRRLTSPMADGRSHAQRDETRFWLASGAAVQLADVQVLWSGDLATVWARVIPVPRK
jgi:hypothetical protein